MLARHAGAGDVAKLQQDANALVADTRVLGDIVDDLLASATMTVGAVPRDRVDMAELATHVRDSMIDYAKTLGVGVHCDVAAGCEVLGSPAALRRALTALVDNALRHEHPGGTVELRVERHNKTVRVAVIDDGAGIEPKAMSNLFTRFAHGDSHTGRSGRQPYGIGLALVSEVAHTHGGDITVTSTPGRGATFTLALPAVD